MGTNQKNRYAIDSYLDRIEEHIEKMITSHNEGNFARFEYYIKEIERGFIFNIEKIIKKTSFTQIQKTRYLNLIKQLNDKKDLPWN